MQWLCKEKQVLILGNKQQTTMAMRRHLKTIVDGRATSVRQSLSHSKLHSDGCEMCKINNVTQGMKHETGISVYRDTVYVRWCWNVSFQTRT